MPTSKHMPHKGSCKGSFVRLHWKSESSQRSSLRCEPQSITAAESRCRRPPTLSYRLQGNMPGGQCSEGPYAETRRHYPRREPPPEANTNKPQQQNRTAVCVGHVLSANGKWQGDYGLPSPAMNFKISRDTPLKSREMEKRLCNGDQTIRDKAKTAPRLNRHPAPEPYIHIRTLDPESICTSQRLINCLDLGLRFQIDWNRIMTIVAWFQWNTQWKPKPIRTQKPES